MSRGYPRFLYSNPQNTKDQGPFIVHLLKPRFICRVVDHASENVWDLKKLYISISGKTIELIDVFDTSASEDTIKDRMSDMHEWWVNQP